MKLSCSTIHFASVDDAIHFEIPTEELPLKEMTSQYPLDDSATGQDDMILLLEYDGDFFWGSIDIEGLKKDGHSFVKEMERKGHFGSLLEQKGGY